MVRPHPKIARFFKIFFSLPVFLFLYFFFWLIYSKAPFDFEYVDGPFVVLFYYYLPLALFIIALRFFRKISRFYSVTLSIVGVIALPVVFYFISPDMNVSVSYATQFRYFYSLALPIGLASIITIILSIPAFFRLIFRKPQYFMFTFFLLLSFIFVFTVEYRLYGQFNGYEKFFCSYQKTKDTYSPKVVRIIGSYSEGSGFFIKENMVVTSRHVVKNEDYPKIVLPNGKFLTPTKIVLSGHSDIAFLTVEESKPEYVIDMPDETHLSSEEEVLSFGYALGSEIKGSPTILPLRFENYRSMSADFTDYLQFSSPLVEGMSGGPVIDKCGDLVGVNTITTSGTSLIVGIESLDESMKFPSVFNEEPVEIELEPGATTEASVYAYYYLLKARDTKGCYNLLSAKYKINSSYEEWTARFPNVISVEIYDVKEIKPNLVYVMFDMSEWIDGEQSYHSYEGTWETVKEGDAYHLTRSYITELESIYDLQGPDYFLNPEVKK